MGRIYTVPYTGTVTNAGGNADLFELMPAAQKPIKLRGIILGNASEFGDAAEESFGMSIIRLPATVTGGNGTAVTPVPMDSANPAAGFTAEANGATVATTSGSAVIVFEFAWNIRNSPYELWFPDTEFCPKAKNAEGLFVRMNTTPVDDWTFYGTAIVEEE